MIITNCAACAVPLAHDTPRCVRCKTRYCNSTCQHDHWRRGHKQICKKIHRGGNAEQYHADTKYKEAVKVAVEACADDTKGQTCYICTEALHWKTKEGLVRMCACRGTAGFAHLSCLAEQAKLLFEEVEENNLDNKQRTERWHRWHTCGLCEQEHHGVVRCALGWACWKTYVDRPEENSVRPCAMSVLGTALLAAGHTKDALSVQEAELSMRQRLGDSEQQMLIVQSNIASSYQMLGQFERAVPIGRDVYSGRLKLLGKEHGDTLISANNYATSLIRLQRFEEAKELLRKMTPVARRVLGEATEVTLRVRLNYAEALYSDDHATLDNLREAVTTIEDVERTARRVFGGAYPPVRDVENSLQYSRAALRARETPPPPRST